MRPVEEIALLVTAANIFTVVFLALASPRSVVQQQRTTHSKFVLLNLPEMTPSWKLCPFKKDTYFVVCKICIASWPRSGGLASSTYYTVTERQPQVQGPTLFLGEEA